jgi:NAD(P)-dependent dehydrogenase (short-subunit alcohol dehydrogenase family)
MGLKNPTLEGRVIAVAGGSRGIGLAAARKFADAGAKVLVGAIDVESETPHISSEDQFASMWLDVRDEGSVRMFFDFAESLGSLYGFVNSAGIGVFKRLEDLTLPEWSAVIETNLTGAFLCTREAAKRMAQVGGGRILNIGSVANCRPLVENSAYGASKAGLRMLSAIVNEEYSATRVRTTFISLGAVYTDVWKGRMGFDPSDMLRTEDVAALLTHLLSIPLQIRVDEQLVLPGKGIL